MATITKGYTFGSTELVTNSKLHTLVDSATITGIVEAELDITSSPATDYVMTYDGSKMNWVAQQSLASISSVSTLQEAFDAGQTITIADNDNQVLALTQNDTTNNPNALTIVNTGTGAAIEVTGGWIINSTQPAFCAHPASAQENIVIGSAVTVVLGTERFDQGGNFASNTFTAPVTGKYQLNVNLQLSDIDSAATEIQVWIVTSNDSYLVASFEPDQLFAADSALNPAISIVADMDASDTAYVTITIEGGANQVDVNIHSFFSGALLN